MGNKFLQANKKLPNMEKPGAGGVSMKIERTSRRKGSRVEKTDVYQSTDEKSDDSALGSPSENIDTLPKPQRCLSAEEAAQFLSLPDKESLAYLHGQPDGPPFIQLSLRKKIYCLQDLIGWLETRKRR